MTNNTMSNENPKNHNISDIRLYSNNEHRVFMPNGKPAFDCIDTAHAERAVRLLNFDLTKTRMAQDASKERSRMKHSLVTFLAQHCSQEPGASVSLSDFKSSYLAFCELSGVRPEAYTHRALSAWLHAAGKHVGRDPTNRAILRDVVIKP